MKIYFTGSTTYRSKYGKYYDRIISKLQSLGHDVESTHAIEHDASIETQETKEKRLKDYEEMLGWIKKADICVYEVSFPSTVTIGHDLTRALGLGKPVLALYYEDTVPSLLEGLETERFCLTEYSDNNLEETLKFELKELSSLPNQRFTMLLSGDLTQHLGEVAEMGGNKSEYIRELIRKDMEK